MACLWGWTVAQGWGPALLKHWGSFKHNSRGYLLDCHVYVPDESRS
jgi:hypothetical protein